VKESPVQEIGMSRAIHLLPLLTALGLTMPGAAGANGGGPDPEARMRGGSGTDFAAVTGPAYGLAGGDWKVTAIGGAAVPDGVSVSLAFDLREGRMAGHGGCNRYSAPLTLAGRELAVGPAVATRMACPGAPMEVEGQFFAALARIDGFDVTGEGELRLLAAGVPTIRARR
jgi:heat shock protein HslJ